MIASRPTSDRPLNACVFSPTKEHVLLGGGQDATSVPPQQAAAAETQLITSPTRSLGVKGHFGPIAPLAISPLGKSSFGRGAFATSDCTTDARLRT